jgi:predicted transcriptional regulator
MRRETAHVTDTELAIMQVLWEHGPATRRHITDALYPNGAAAHYATVQKLLERLEAKGLVRTDRSQSVLTFTAALGREDLLGSRLRETADKLCGGSLAPLLMHLVRADSLTTEQLDELQAYVEELRRKAKSKPKRR